MYLKDNASHYPLAAPIPDPVYANGEPLLSAPLARYVHESKDAFRCPADHDDGIAYFKRFGMSYFYYHELGTLGLTKSLMYLQTHSISRTPLLWDAERFHDERRPWNYLYCDGHVEPVTNDPASKIFYGEQANW